MRVTFDPAKDAANLEKHGISLLDAMGFEWDTALVWPDTRQDYEKKANTREVKRYAET